MTTVSVRATGAMATVRGMDRPLALLAVMAFVVQIGVAVMLPLLPLYAQQFGATPFVLGLLTSAHAVMSAVGQLAGGFLTERFAGSPPGRRSASVSTLAPTSSSPRPRRPCRSSPIAAWRAWAAASTRSPSGST